MKALIAISLLAFATTLAHAHPGEAVIPDSEYERARALQAEGPDTTQGVEAVKALGQVSLADELQRMGAHHVLRARELTIAAGGVIAVHEHHGRPGVAYILEGEMLEYRSDRDEPTLRRSGDTAFEYTGLVHWWENPGDVPARALVIDIVPDQ